MIQISTVTYLQNKIVDAKIQISKIVLPSLDNNVNLFDKRKNMTY